MISKTSNTLALAALTFAGSVWAQCAAPTAFPVYSGTTLVTVAEATRATIVFPDGDPQDVSPNAVLWADIELTEN